MIIKARNSIYIQKAYSNSIFMFLFSNVISKNLWVINVSFYVNALYSFFIEAINLIVGIINLLLSSKSIIVKSPLRYRLLIIYCSSLPEEAWRFSPVSFASSEGELAFSDCSECNAC